MLYKLAYIVPLKYTEKEIPKIIKKISELIKKFGVTDIKEESWNKRKIAYPIKQNRHGYFVAAQISAESKNLAKINQELNNLPEVLRHSIVKFKPGSFNQTKKARAEEPPNSSNLTSTKTHSKTNYLKEKSISKPEKKDSKDSKISENIKLSPKETDPKKNDKSKIALEDLDKKLEEILSSDNLKT